jgi:hypothetical protein
MTVQIVETSDSRALTDGDNPKIERRYKIWDTDSESEALTKLKDEAPLRLGSLRRVDPSVTPLGGGLWEGVAPYEKSTDGSDDEGGDDGWTFDTTGGTAHITASRQTISRTSYTEAVTAPDFKGAIGVNKDSVTGVDITVPVGSFSETYRIPTGLVDTAYKITLMEMTGKVNSTTFRGLEAGEVLFMGARGSKKGTDDWEITFLFAVSRNAVNIPVGEITVPEKKGWDYLWVRYDEFEDGTAKSLVKRPVAAYVERVYEFVDFAPLGI